MFTVDREKTAAEIPRIYLQLEKFFQWWNLLLNLVELQKKGIFHALYLVIEFIHEMNNDLGSL